MAKKVFLGVGHGGTDPGAIGNGFEEEDLNLAIALECQRVLVRHGVIVGISRTKDENDDLNEEIRECNAFAPDLAVDIHNNAGGGDGAEAYYHYKGGTGKTLAENILSEIVKIGQNSRGAKTRKNAQGNDYYGWIRLTNCPAVIVECAFVDNATDIKIIDTTAEQKAMGVAVAKGILKTLGVAYKEEAAPKPTTTTTELYRVRKTWQDAASQIGAYKSLANAKNACKSGYSVFDSKGNVIYTPAVKNTIKVGSTVKLNKGAKTYTGGSIASFVYNRNHKVKEINGNRVVITYLGIVVAAVNIKDLTLV